MSARLRNRIWLLVPVAVLVLALGLAVRTATTTAASGVTGVSGGTGATGASGSTGAALPTGIAIPAPTLPKIGHVFEIVLENEPSSTTFAPGSKAPYLANTLRAQGAYIPNYYGTGHVSNDNYIAMISGQAPNLQNQTDCLMFDNVTPGTLGAYGQASGEGCVYPSTVQTIGNQLTNAGLTWRDYNDSMGADPGREAGQCAHPGIGQQDNTQSATAKDQYATRHNPFVYFHSIIDDTTYCNSHVVNLSLLTRDLASVTDTPNYVFITPSLCNDGHDPKCANGGLGGLAAADAFLQKWVPLITSSPAFTQQNGLLMITFDESDTGDTKACCGEIAGPGSPFPGLTGSGGGRTGAVMVSPCIARGTVSQQPYNHYTMLRSFEDLFGLSHLGYAGLPGESSLGSDVFTGACDGVPVVSLSTTVLPGRSHAVTRVRLSWHTAGPVSATSYTAMVRKLGAGSVWQTLRSSTSATSLTYRGLRGSSYQFQVTPTGWNGTGVSGSAIVKVPLLKSTPAHHKTH
ncbi:MAG: alkaline phosphatase family protein [Solirubrobacteraceae bacterium]